MNLPTWLEANERIVNGTYTPLDVFVVNNEPAGREAEEQFRHELEAVLEYVSGLTQLPPDLGQAQPIQSKKLLPQAGDANR